MKLTMTFVFETENKPNEDIYLNITKMQRGDKSIGILY